MAKKILNLFFLVSIIHLIAELIDMNSITTFTKPLLMPLLAIFYFLSKNELNKISRLTILALIFSFLGDVFLMFTNVNANYFLVGLGAFLIAQITYAYIFSNINNKEVGFLRKKPIWVLPFLIYLSILLFLLLSNIPSLFIIPIIIYGIAITSMALSAFNLKGKIPTPNWNSLMYGVLLFLLSDSLIGINKFLMPIPFAGFLVMSTYIIAQFLIVENLRKIG